MNGKLEMLLLLNLQVIKFTPLFINKEKKDNKQTLQKGW